MFAANLLFRRFLSVVVATFVATFFHLRLVRSIVTLNQSQIYLGLKRASIGFAGIVNFSPGETTVLVESVSTERAKMVVREKPEI